MLRRNPKGGRPLKLGSIDWDETSRGFQYKIGYCPCGKMVLASAEELGEIIEEFDYLRTAKKRIIRGIAMFLLKRLI